MLVEYQKAPAVTRDRMYLDTMQQIFSNVTKVLVDQKGGNNLLMLPARQADPDVERQHGRNRYRAEAAHGARGHPANGHHESVAGSVSRP